MPLRSEFDRQVRNLLSKGYPELAGLNEDGFLRRIVPLRERLPELRRQKDSIDFAIVITGDLVPRDKAMSRVELADKAPLAVTTQDGRALPARPSETTGRAKGTTFQDRRSKRGFTRMEADDLERFTTLEGVELPRGSAYLVADIDTGAGTLNVTPDEAIKTIARESRSPLTVDEGIALLTHHPDVLMDKNAYSMLGSRCGDRRVTAMWISKGSPRLGWCWAGNPHTWLGSASCGSRVGA